MNPIIKICQWYFSKKALPYWCILLMDCGIIFLAEILSLYFSKGVKPFISNFWELLLSIIIYLLPYIVGFRVMRTYTGILRYSSFKDLVRVSSAMLIGALLCIALNGLVDHTNLIHPNNRTIILCTIMGTLLMWLIRIVVKNLFEQFRIGKNTIRVFIYGTRHGGISLAKSISNDINQKYNTRAFVTPDKDMQKHSLMGLPIYNDDANIINIMKREKATCLMVSPLQSEHFREQEELVNKLMEANIQILMMNPAEEWDGKSDLKHQQLHEVDIEDLLPRDKIEVDMDAIGNLLRGKKILITGAAGSIGSEMVRQIAIYNPAEMVLIDQAETPMHDTRLMMNRNYSNIKAETIVTSITNQTHMEKIFASHRPDYVFHAAAYKHVPMMEDNPALAVQNNIFGTQIIADLAVKYGTKKFVMISTDKAVNPTNVMGCSKRICEIYCQSLNKAILDQKDNLSAPSILQVDGTSAVTQFVTTRFGNVLGSNGSVIPIFKEQIRKGGPVTVTHPDIIRYFMLIPEACRLVLEAGTMGKGGEIFVFDMGKPVRIVDLAKRMITLSHAQNIEIKFTGLRDGEKLYEEVLNDQEITKPTHHPKIKIAAVREYDYETAKANEERLLNASYTYDDLYIVKLMKEIVPEYKSQHSKYEILDQNVN